jgi:CHAT domain-containing protein
LYESLIAPIEADIKDSHILMLSLDGALRYIPFSTLYDGKQYLLERYQLVIYTPAAKDKLTAASTPQWRINGLGVTQEHEGFSKLPGVQAELAGIVGRDGLPGVIHLDGDFTAHQMQVSLKQNIPVLHVASHFKFTPGTETDSFLLLGDGAHLSLRDIREGDYSFDNLDLLTLSACDTAMQGGQDANGREVEGLGALAQNKGAKAVLASLWSIEDASTAQLMQTMYRDRQYQHLNKAEALRRAQLALLHGENSENIFANKPDKRGGTYVELDGKVNESIPFETNPKAPFSHPYYWAAFILMGNWL